MAGDDDGYAAMVSDNLGSGNDEHSEVE